MNYNKYNRNIAVKDWWERTAAKIIIISETLKYQVAFITDGFILTMVSAHIERAGLTAITFYRVAGLACIIGLMVQFVLVIASMMIGVIYTSYVDSLDD